MKGEVDVPNAKEVKASPSEAEYLKLIGDRVREARARRGMTRKILAKDSGVSERYLAQLEGGQGNISALLLRDIARALDVRMESLVLEGFEPSVDLIHTTEFLRRLTWRRHANSW
jgi:XRE family transcriptional regulator, aerobic/anaerobic benzoate catabolism transcriptional regulator